MKYDAELLEYLVREVIRRLTADGHVVARGTPQGADSVVAGRELALTERLVTTGTLKGKLAGVATVSIGRRSVITPAARDELSSRKIALQRTDS